jgi:hypothetical protein
MKHLRGRREDEEAREGLEDQRAHVQEEVTQAARIGHPGHGLRAVRRCE